MRLTIILIIFIFTNSCKPEEISPVASLPMNLITSYTLDDGFLQIEAIADNANFYSFIFYDNGDSTYLESSDGTANYTYNNVGVYEIKSRAHTTYYDYIESDEVIEVNNVGYTGGIPTQGYITPQSYVGYTLVWSDEFNGNSLSSDWIHEVGNDPGGLPGWGNNELQFYTEENTIVEDGLLKITAKQQSVSSFNYTSSRIKTQDLQSFKYGRIDVRAAIPYSKGFWPAIWMLGNNINSVGWPYCGEIDIMELIGGGSFNDRTIYGTVHWDDGGSQASFGDSNSLPNGEIYAEEFHVFSIIWNESSIKFLRDDQQYHVVDTTPSELDEFNNEFFFILNLAIGGNWPGNPDASSVFPQTMAVDYIRVFQ